jgi:uncharacterized protein (TIGR02217 family)
MSNALFPALQGLGWSVTKTPAYSTLTRRAVSGKQARVALYTTPLWTWQLVYTLLRDDAASDLRTLMGFFVDRRGDFDSFLYSDPSDNAASGQVLGTGDGNTVLFPLVRRLRVGGIAEPVWLAPNTSPAISVGGTAVAATPTNDAVTGWPNAITLTTAPPAGAVVTADFSYIWRVHFKASSADFEEFAWRLWRLQSLELESDK